MPYINQENRQQLGSAISELASQLKELGSASGDLNYTITKLCLSNVDAKGINYESYNSILGVLEGVKLELYRRQMSLYEDSKIIQNGDL